MCSRIYVFYKILDRKIQLTFSENMSLFHAALFKKAKFFKNNNIIKFDLFRNNTLFIKVSENSKPTVIQCEEDLCLLNEGETVNTVCRRFVDKVENSDLQHVMYSISSNHRLFAES